ncbi:TetR/AcrR family transcriptional regulator [Dethiobacter alkaliphilus]|uniref:Transcriptional regulator, TetR family n=1 Tax=Dethiobacter alkaliphilus AHT 1 TaxID=555088 RepID=C0GFF5_DETAL|nr:TetR/AcrR family transcriptional regulator [Dethiobacter alkaliphilus]EEG77915.1 transcriptional regulator, TetR family [Dethiobacter alkaliphilus AHT 1]
MREELSKAEQTRERILNVAIREFALQGYNKASTNHIMEQVGMAKGLLFHYYSNKQKLYLACLQKVLAEVQKELDQFMQQMPQDLFERLASFLRWKNQLAIDQPLTFRFLLGISKLPSGVRSNADGMLVSLRKKNSQLLADYDQTLWDPKVNQKDALEVVVLLFDSMDHKWVQQMDADTPQDQKELLCYALRLLDVLKVGFYRTN